MSMAVKYAMNKRRMAGGGEVSPASECMACKGGRCMAHGGLVDRIMDKRGAKPMADSESADFDYMDQRDAGDEANYTGENSGDELGDAAVEDEEKDLVGRIMRSRSKKDRMPRPA